ncbi:MAG: chitobiase/beta-hexosaminidase C-terminal domain-containing protein [Actinophytocola sp.]|uniref:chitobiase/beta-hexosaminidase C-terminal domain-containing protein n=1 Tax=Actinophytocola sp. TaxID=1872138 RepID=UPI003C7235AF
MAVDMTDAIPLMEADGTTGRNNARDIRTGLLSALMLTDANGTLARPGILPRRYIDTTGFEFVDLKAIQLGSPGQAVQLYPGKAIVTRTGQGPYLLTQETTITNYPLDAADPSNPRIDILYLRLYDKGIGDSGGGPHGPKVEHLNGTPAGSPTVPSFPTDTVPIARILRPANTNNVTAANITDLRKSTTLNGGSRPLLPGDSLSDAGLVVGEKRLRAATSAQIAAGANPMIEEVWTAHGKWWPTTNYQVIARNERDTNATTTATTAGTAYRIFNTGGPILAGRTYEISGRGSLRSNTAGVTAQIDFRYTTNGTEPTTSSTQIAREILDLADTNVPETITWKFNYEATADVTLRVVAAMFTASGGGQLIFEAAAGPSPGEIVITDMGPTVAISGNIY